MQREIRTRHTSGIFERIKKFFARQKSLSDAFYKLSEEAYVRLCDIKVIRRTLSSLSSNRDPEKWVFLVGCYNSGTTLLQNLLSVHPDLSGLPREGVRFTDQLSNLELNGHHMIWDDDWRSVAHPDASETIAAVKNIKKDWRPFWKRNATIFIEKSVSNTARIRWLERNFDNAYFVAIHRNGYCVSEGLHRRCRPPDWLRQQSGLDHYPLTKTAHQWSMINETMLESIRSTKHLKVAFEELASNPVKILNQIFGFLQINAPAMTWDGKILSIADQKFEIHNPNVSSLERLGERASEIEEIIDPIMVKLGYENA